MKKIVITILLTLCLVPSFAQIDTNIVVYSWKLDESLANRLRVEVDTNLAGFQIYNPVYRQYTAVESLGNFGLPAQSAVFTERSNDQEFILVNPFLPFMKRFENTCFYNTRKPFTKLTYIKGGSNQTKEEVFDVFHSQNLTKTLNFGLNYTTIGALGDYSFQKVKNNSFRFFSSLSSKNYSYHLIVNYNKVVTDENGGVRNDTLITDTTFAFSKDIPTLFSGTETSLSHSPDVYNEIKNLNVLAVQELSFRSNPKQPDSSSVARKTRVFYPKIVYIFSLDRFLRNFVDKNPSVGLHEDLYQNAYFSRNRTSDSLLYLKVLNDIRLQFQGRRNNHYFIDYTHEIKNFTMWGNSDLPSLDSGIHAPYAEPFHLADLKNKISKYNVFVSTGFSKIFARRLDMNFYGRYYLGGYNSGDFLLSGNLKMNFGKLEKPVSFFASAVSKVQTPDFLYTRYISNNFIWKQNFKKTSTQHLSTNLSISSKKFAIQADYYLFSSLIFMNYDAVPAQYGNALSVFALGITKQFDFWKLTSIHKLVYQKSENKNVLGLPELAYYNSTYLKHLFNFRSTGGKLLTMIGIDLFYNTKYYANAYMPALNAFYRQDEKQLGNYPYLDAFLNVNLKRFRFFLKLEHLNAGWGLFEQNYFSVLHYPQNGRNLKFGLSWTFYD